MKQTLLLFCFLICAQTVAAASPILSDGREDPVYLEADELHADRATGRLEASGAARLRQKTLTLMADSIWYNQKENEAGASGRVYLVEENGSIAADELLLRLNDETARLTRAHAFLSGQGYHLAGELIEKLGASTYRVIDGSFTACSGTPPAWKFGASQVDLTLGGYARARSMFFYIRDVPILYFPYFFYPVKTERESGMLLPHFGLSNLRGFELALSYYQVLARNMDATLELDLYTRAGLGKTLEYRYIVADDNAGEMRVTHISGFQDRKDVYAGRWLHSGTLPGDILLRGDLEYVSNRTYLTDFTTNASDYNRELVESYLYLARPFGKSDLSLQAEYVKDLSNETTTNPLSRLPEAHLAVLPQRFGASPLYLRFNLEGNNLQRGAETVGQTLLARPAAEIVLRPRDGLSLTAGGGYRALLTRSDANDDTTGFFDAAAALSARFQRTYGLQSSRLRHVIEPEVSYQLIEDRGQADFPQLLPGETALPVDRVSFAVTNYLFRREAPIETGTGTARQLLRLRLSSGYNLDPSIADQRSEPLRTEIDLQPSDRVHLIADASYGLTAGRHRWESLYAGVRLQDSRRDELQLQYYARDEDGLDYLAGRVAAPLTDRLTAVYEGRISIDGGRFLEHITELDYRGDCWGVTLTFHERPDDREYLVNFTLAGLGGRQRGRIFVDRGSLGAN